jgi:glycosyltransferase involved in cell wall biosynthesis
MRPRLLTIVPFLWSGAGRAIVRLQLELQAAGWDCEVVTAGRSRGLSDWPDYVRDLRRHRIPRHRIDFFDRDPAVTWQGVAALADLLRRTPFDLVHAHAGVPAFAATAARDITGLGLPVVATLHSWNPDRPSWMNRADVWALNRCDRVVTDSRSYANYLVGEGLEARRCETILLGVDLPAADVERPTRRSRGLRVLSVGRIEPRKDQETLLRGFARLRERSVAELAIVGPDGDAGYADRLREAAGRNGWTRGVRFVGKARSVEPWYRWADVFVTTSRDEGLGLSLLEAMAHRLPAVCTMVEGHADFVRPDRNGLVIPTGDPDALADALARLEGDARLRQRLGRQGRDTVARLFDWHRTTAAYLRLFNRCCEKANRRRGR